MVTGITLSVLSVILAYASLNTAVSSLTCGEAPKNEIAGSRGSSFWQETIAAARANIYMILFILS
jgi:hypothetical protein